MKQSDIFKKELETLDKLSKDFSKKRDELLIKQALYKEFRKLLDYSNGASISITNINQYINDKLFEL